MPAFLDIIRTALPNLAAISIGFSKDGVASAAILSDTGGGILRGQRAPISQPQVYTIYASEPALVSLEFRDWPPTGCCDNHMLVIGSFFSVEDTTSVPNRLVWSAPAAGVKAPDTVRVIFEPNGKLTLSTKQEVHVHDLGTKALNNDIAAYICLRTSATDTKASIT